MVSEIRQGYDFFQNRACQYFPCHKGADAENFSCLFCYCPLYALGRRCGGAFRYTPSGVKDCSRCAFPHKRENYDAVLERYAEIADVVRRMDAIPDGDWKMEGKSMREWKAAALDGAAMAAAQARWDAVAKPLNSLGLWEAWVVRIAGMQGTPDVRIAPRCALVFCADHGVVEEGVSQSGSEVTALVAQSVAEGAANVNLMAAAAGAKAFAVDMGMARDVAHPDMIVLKQAKGTANFTRGPAMPREAAERAVESGADLVAKMKERGYRMIATGEMGIGNTTAATAVSCALLGRAPRELTGRGAGLSDAGLLRKISAIERALETNRPDASDPMDVLSKVGGYEIAGMAGAFLGGMEQGVPIVIDGAISAAAALLAARICPAARDFMLPSHASREPMARALLEALDLQPPIHADMALGEGTGAVMVFPLLDMALRVYAGEHTFGNLGMEAYEPQEGKP